MLFVREISRQLARFLDVQGHESIYYETSDAPVGFSDKSYYLSVVTLRIGGHDFELVVKVNANEQDLLDATTDFSLVSGIPVQENIRSPEKIRSITSQNLVHKPPPCSFQTRS